MTAGLPLTRMTRPSAMDSTGWASDSAKSLLAGLHARAVASVRGDTLLARHGQWDGCTWSYDDGASTVVFDIPAESRLVVVGAGKAAAALALGLESMLGDRIGDGCIIVKYGHVEPLRRIRQIEAGHPVPDQASVVATRELLRTLESLRPQDRVFVLLTGGASSLLVSPVADLTLDDKAVVTQQLLRSGATIQEINAVRKALSTVKGGGLLDHIAPARSLTLLISDVPDGDHGTIGSGPTVVPSGNDEPPSVIIDRYGLAASLPPTVMARLRSIPAGRNSPPQAGHALHLLADSATIIRSVRELAASAALDVYMVDHCMTGNTHAAARSFANAAAAVRRDGLRRPVLLVAAGETTLEIKGQGKGGRNQEFALVAARCLDGIEGVTLLSAGTDGTDGPTDAAGAFADGASCARARNAGIDVDAMLSDNDAYHLFEALGDLLITGGSGTNVMDLVLGLVTPESTP